jgi:hypothetical protein
MTKIRVGDIEIDGSQITIGGQQMTSQSANHVVVTTPPAPTPQTRTSPQPPPAQPNTDLAKLPGRPMLWFLAGMSIFVHSAFFAAVTVPYFIYLGLGISVLGILKQRAHREDARHQHRLEKQKQLQLEAALAPTLEKLRSVLSEASRPLTIEQLSECVELTQAELLRGLAHLRAQAELIEDLDTESGEWVYSLTRRQLPPQDLDARLAALEEANTPGRR